MRYPGGKRRLTDVVMGILNHNGLHDVEYCEPFSGGASVGLALLFNEYARKIHLNDYCRPVYAFWKTVLDDANWLCSRIKKTRVSIAEWQRQKSVYRNEPNECLRDLGFATLFLNRTNRSGILTGGVIGGQKQDGRWKIGARFNKENIIQRIMKIHRYRDRIQLHQLDGRQFCKEVSPMVENGFAFFDPPYIELSDKLYLNCFDTADHVELAEHIQDINMPWIVTYDIAAIKKKLYKNYRRVTYGLNYTAQNKYLGTEVMFVSDDLRFPRAQDLFGNKIDVIKTNLHKSVTA